LEKVLTALREHTVGKLICLFGCGGDRDRGKRPQMGAVVERLADRIIVTDDNPRSEAGDTIIRDILRGMSNIDLVQIERNRDQAIAQAIEAAGPGDVVAICGKGHETTQQIGSQIHEFSDRAHVARILGEALPC